MNINIFMIDKYLLDEIKVRYVKLFYFVYLCKYFVAARVSR